VGLSLADAAGLQAAHSTDTNCILLFLVGGPSQLDTWDPKPSAPESIRGPFRAIPTSVSGIQLSENFPRMAAMADRYAIVRSVHHREAPIHETGHQLMQTGRLFRGEQDYPHYGAVVSHLRGNRRRGVPAAVTLPAPIGNTGVSVSHAQGSGPLGPAHEPLAVQARYQGTTFTVEAIDAPVATDLAQPRSRQALIAAIDEAQETLESLPAHGGTSAAGFDPILARHARRAFDLDAEPEALRSRYGRNTFGQSCLLACRLVEHGVRFVTVNMFDTVFHQVTWDCHADSGALPATLDDYRRVLCPMFDAAYTALLEDLHQRGLLGSTMVVAMGEFGRTPQVNPRGGRDHWPGCWSVLFAGGKVRGGQVIGASDRTASEPRDRPVSPAEIAASVYHGLGIAPDHAIPGPDARPIPVAPARPVSELFTG
jgi:hypothetical protein